MRVAHIVPSLEERHGGPSKSVRALANALGRAGLDVTLLTTLEKGHLVPAADDVVPLQVFPREWPLAWCRSEQLADHLRAQPYDCHHAHSLWLLPLGYAHRAAGRHNGRLVISPRGMMSGWAWRHHRWRKKIAELALHPGAFAAAAGWHATSLEEADDIRQLGFRQPVCVAPNAVPVPAEAALAEARAAWSDACPALHGRRVALFYSRLHRKKRLRELVSLWLGQPRDDWFLLIVGVPEEYTPDEVNGWIAEAGGSAHARAFDGAGRPPPFAIAELFVLPSHSENFGLVIAESLAAGVPTLVTDTTPWRDLARHEAGWCVAWEAFGATLARARTESRETLAARGVRGRAWVARDFTWENSAQLLRAFYRDLLHG